MVHLCQVCEDKPAEVFCGECNIYLCNANDCDKDTHSVSQIMNKHLRRPLTSADGGSGAPTPSASPPPSAGLSAGVPPLVSNASLASGTAAIAKCGSCEDVASDVWCEECAMGYCGESANKCDSEIHIGKMAAHHRIPYTQHIRVSAPQPAGTPAAAAASSTPAAASGSKGAGGAIPTCGSCEDGAAEFWCEECQLGYCQRANSCDSDVHIGKMSSHHRIPIEQHIKPGGGSAAAAAVPAPQPVAAPKPAAPTTAAAAAGGGASAADIAAWDKKYGGDIPKCSACEELPAEVYCENCHLAYCVIDHCDEQVHVGAAKSHTRVSIEKHLNIPKRPVLGAGATTTTAAAPPPAAAPTPTPPPPISRPVSSAPPPAAAAAASGAASPGLCSNCETLPASVFCKDENARFCAECDSEMHVGKQKSHIRTPIGAATTTSAVPKLPSIAVTPTPAPPPAVSRAPSVAPPPAIASGPIPALCGSCEEKPPTVTCQECMEKYLCGDCNHDLHQVGATKGHHRAPIKAGAATAAPVAAPVPVPAVKPAPAPAAAASTAAKGSIPTCSFCSEAPAVVWCSSCSQALCTTNDCDAEKHAHGTFASHSRIPIGDYLASLAAPAAAPVAAPKPVVVVPPPQPVISTAPKYVPADPSKIPLIVNEPPKKAAAASGGGDLDVEDDDEQDGDRPPNNRNNSTASRGKASGGDSGRGTKLSTKRSTMTRSDGAPDDDEEDEDEEDEDADAAGPTNSNNQSNAGNRNATKSSLAVNSEPAKCDECKKRVVAFKCGPCKRDYCAQCDPKYHADRGLFLHKRTRVAVEKQAGKHRRDKSRMAVTIGSSTNANNSNANSGNNSLGPGRDAVTGGPDLRNQRQRKSIVSGNSNDPDGRNERPGGAGGLDREYSTASTGGRDRSYSAGTSGGNATSGGGGGGGGTSGFGRTPRAPPSMAGSDAWENNGVLSELTRAAQAKIDKRDRMNRDSGEHQRRASFKSSLIQNELAETLARRIERGSLGGSGNGPTTPRGGPVSPGGGSLTNSTSLFLMQQQQQAQINAQQQFLVAKQQMDAQAAAAAQQAAAANAALLAGQTQLMTFMEKMAARLATLEAAKSAPPPASAASAPPNGYAQFPPATPPANSDAAAVAMGLLTPVRPNTANDGTAIAMLSSGNAANGAGAGGGGGEFALSPAFQRQLVSVVSDTVSNLIGKPNPNNSAPGHRRQPSGQPNPNPFASGAAGEIPPPPPPEPGHGHSERHSHSEQKEMDSNAGSRSDSDSDSDSDSSFSSSSSSVNTLDGSTGGGGGGKDTALRQIRTNLGSRLGSSSRNDTNGGGGGGATSRTAKLKDMIILVSENGHGTEVRDARDGGMAGEERRHKHHSHSRARSNSHHPSHSTSNSGSGTSSRHHNRNNSNVSSHKSSHRHHSGRHHHSSSVSDIDDYSMPIPPSKAANGAALRGPYAYGPAAAAGSNGRSRSRSSSRASRHPSYVGMTEEDEEAELDRELATERAKERELVTFSPAEMVARYRREAREELTYRYQPPPPVAAAMAWAPPPVPVPVPHSARSNNGGQSPSPPDLSRPASVLGRYNAPPTAVAPPNPVHHSAYQSNGWTANSTGGGGGGAASGRAGKFAAHAAAAAASASAAAAAYTHQHTSRSNNASPNPWEPAASTAPAGHMYQQHAAMHTPPGMSPYPYAPPPSAIGYYAHAPQPAHMSYQHQLLASGSTDSLASQPIADSHSHSYHSQQPASAYVHRNSGGGNGGGGSSGSAPSAAMFAFLPPASNSGSGGSSSNGSGSGSGGGSGAGIVHARKPNLLPYANAPDPQSNRKYY